MSKNDNHREEAERLREQLSKLRHWMTGYTQGSGNTIPNEDAVRQTMLLLEKAFK